MNFSLPRYHDVCSYLQFYPRLAHALAKGLPEVTAVIPRPCFSKITYVLHSLRQFNPRGALSIHGGLLPAAMIETPALGCRGFVNLMCVDGN